MPLLPSRFSNVVPVFKNHFSNNSLSFHFTCLDLFFIFSHNYIFNQQTTKPVPLPSPSLNDALNSSSSWRYSLLLSQIHTFSLFSFPQIPFLLSVCICMLAAVLISQTRFRCRGK
uniref:Uncharacterized protein n=1 Tax=Meloidogyne enterolobii TaxID=390850 RepID=A0A6V7TL30_MELEN|nr:unnamed protein product [Meloidogyne enterolobii]